MTALRLAGSTPARLIVAPTDLRAIDPFVAEEILAGRFPLAGRVLDTEGESPFEIDLPSHEFAVRLHSFGWLRHMLRSVIAMMETSIPPGATPATVSTDTLGFPPSQRASSLRAWAAVSANISGV